LNLREKIEKREAKIGIIGLGYVGLPLAVEFADKGFVVVGIDIDERKVELVNSGVNYIGDVESKRFKALVEKRMIQATKDYSSLAQCDAINICVPTPFTKSKDPDISYIVSATEGIATHLHKGQLIVLKSTTFPETTEKIVLPILEKTGLKVGKDFYLSFSPERIDPGNKKFTVHNTPVVVGGVTQKCSEMTRLLYQTIVNQVVCVSSARVAEMTKLLENIFRSVNIALVNELACLCERMRGLNIWEVIDAAATKPFGFMPFYPGPGIGGHCILVDPYYLAWKAREYDFHTNFIELAAETNENMPFFVADKVIKALSEAGKCSAKSKILILGVTFKKDVDDTRNSPALKIMQILEGKVAKISYNDPYVPKVIINTREYRSIKLTEGILAQTDCVLITANHTIYDYEWLAAHSKLIVDTRNATKFVKRTRARIIKIGKS